MRKKLAALTMCAALAAGSLYGCAPEDGTSASAAAPASTEAQAESKGEETTAAAASNVEVNEDLEGDLVFAIWDNNLMDYIDQNDMAGKFQEAYPNINIEVEKIKDDSEYWNAMKMRASANQLPDVMFNKPFTLSRFKDYLIDLSDLDATRNNELAAGYGLDGKILGIPMTAGYEYVYYWKDMFEEAGVEVPTTWDQLKEVSRTLQDYYGKDNPDFMAIALGAKDEWPDYPFMEFMPALEGGNGQNWNDMAKTDRLLRRIRILQRHTRRHMTCSPPVCSERTRWALEATRPRRCLPRSRQPSRRWETGDCKISRTVQTITPSWEHSIFPRGIRRATHSG